MNVDPFVSAIATGLPPMSLGGGTANMGAPFGSLTAQSAPLVVSDSPVRALAKPLRRASAARRRA